MNLNALLLWAWTVRERPPDFWVGDEPYPQLRRWHVIPKNDRLNVWLHQFLKDDPTLHDHPFTSTSLILSGGYREFFIDGSFSVRRPGEIVHRNAVTAHRVTLIAGQPAMTLFVTGPRIRDWSFVYSDDRKVRWQDDPTYLATRHWRD